MIGIPSFVLQASAPRTKKTSNRIVQIKAKGGGRGFTKILPSKAHEDWFKLAMQECVVIKAKMRQRGVELPLPHSLNVRAIFYRERLSGDATGFYQALADLIQAAGIVINDSQLVSWDGSRLRKDAAKPRIEVFLEVVEERAVERSLFQQ